MAAPIKRNRYLVFARAFYILPLLLSLLSLSCRFSWGIHDFSTLSFGEGVIEVDAPGATWYVDGTRGSDAGSGSFYSPWASPEYAMSMISAGDELVFRGGIYYTDPDVLLTFKAPAPYGRSWDEITVFRAYQRPDGSYEPVLFTGSGGRPPQIEVEGDYIRIEGLIFGGDWKTENGGSAEGNEFHPYGGGRLDVGRHIINCIFFGFNSIRYGALAHSYTAGNIIVHTGTGSGLGDPPVMFFSSKHDVGPDPDPEVTHAIVDNNIILHGAGMAIEGWHTWRNFIVTRNIISGTWGGFTTDGVGAEHQSPAGEGKDHVFANNVIWKTTGGPSTAQRQGAEITSHYTHLVNNIFAGYHNYDWNSSGFRTTQLVLDLRTDSGAYYENLQDLQILDNAYFSIGSTWDWPNQEIERHWILDDGSPTYSTRVATGYDGELIPGTFSATEGQIDQLITDMKTLFTGTPEQIYNRTGQIIAKAAQLREAFTVPRGSILKDGAKAWFDSSITVDPGWVPINPTSYEGFWNGFQNRGLTEWDRDGNPY